MGVVPSYRCWSCKADREKRIRVRHAVQLYNLRLMIMGMKVVGSPSLSGAHFRDNVESPYTGSSETHSRNAFAMSCCNASRPGVVMHHRLVTEIVVNLMFFKVDVLIHIPLPCLQDRRA
jgi:hypothetical protein